MSETIPVYLETPAARQAGAVLLRATQESLAGVVGQPVSVTLEGRQAITVSDLAEAARNVLIEVQFERPAEIHHGIAVLADAATLTPLFSLAPSEDDAEILPADALLSLGDIVSTFLDTLASELTWLRPTPRAWLANLEPVAADARIELPDLVTQEGSLWLLDVTITAANGTSCALSVVLGEQTEQIVCGLDIPGVADDVEAVAAMPAAHLPAPQPAALESVPDAIAITASDLALASAPAPPASAPSTAATVPPSPAPTPVQQAQFKPLGPEQTVGPSNSIDLIRDVPLHISVELGRASLTVRDILALGAGSVVELDRLAGEPVDVLVNDRLIARGEVVIVDESFGVRITEILREGGRKVAV